SRVGAKLVPGYCTDLTPASEFEKVRGQRLQHVLARAKGSGRPTKRERREVDRLFEGPGCFSSAMNVFSKFETELAVRPDDIDLYQHVHSTRYLDYVLAARFDQM